jgi:predicted DNA-binding transcriptional regulator AlpA
MLIDKVMLDVRDVMEITGLGRNNTYELMKSGEFHVKTIGKKYLVHKEVLENWLKGEKSNKKKSRW